MSIIQQNKLDQSKKIMQDAIKRFDPYAIVMAISGGDDSLSAYYALRESGYKPNYILHVNTRTGVQQTSKFVYEFAQKEGIAILYQDAGSTYEDYVRRKGFPGRGVGAHQMMYHLLKKTYISRAIASIRRCKRNKKILIVNGVRMSESNNRRKNFGDDVYRIDGSNIWVNIIHYWQKDDCMAMMNDKTRNPVSIQLCRSGECMCGTMQSQAARMETSVIYPEWGQWLDNLETEIIKTFPWKWGQHISKEYQLEKQGQLRLFDRDDFQPLCSSCKVNQDGL